MRLHCTVPVICVYVVYNLVFFVNGRLLGSSFGVPGIDASYDYVIVGGGTAGLTLATRLAESGTASVAVVEAGSFYELDNGNLSQIPYYVSSSSDISPNLEVVNGLIDWRFLTSPQAALGDRKLHYARGKCLGGSSGRNYLIYQRGTKGTFDKWAEEVGDESYRWASVYPYYRKSPHYTPADTKLRAANASVGLTDEAASFSPDGGPLQVSLPNFAQSWSSYFPQGFEELGVHALEHGTNAGSLIGYAYMTMTIEPRDETRSSSETSFLQSALGKTSLTVYTHALAKKVIFDEEKTARAVLVEVADTQFRLNATKEVIISAGAFQSPQLLMVSGVGPSSTLEQYGIPIIADRPGVGQNMWDNPNIPLSFEVNIETLSTLANDPSLVYEETAAYLLNKSGPLTSFGGDLIGFTKLSDLTWLNLSSATSRDLEDSFPSDWPEIEIASYAIGPVDGVHNFASVAVGLLSTFSRGSVSIKSSDMADAPIIDPAWLVDKRDQEMAIASVKYARRLANTESIKRAISNTGEVLPGPAVQTDPEILEYLKAGVGTYFHASCTCKMGRSNDTMAVIDSEAKVIGVKGLRVVDVSSFPFLIPGQPQGTVYMLAEKIADNILTG